MSCKKSSNLNVLYIHHCGVWGGASRSLFHAVKQIQRKSVNPFLICPYGNVNEITKSLKIPTINVLGISQFANQKLGDYFGHRWLLLLRETFFIPFSFYALLMAKLKWGRKIDLIHVNEYSLIFIGIIAKYLFRKPLVIHVRSIQSTEHVIRCWLLDHLAKLFADSVIAIDGAVANSLSNSVVTTVIHNGETSKENIKPTVKTTEAHEITFGIVANFLAFKGIYEFVEAAKICLREKGTTKAKFMIFGDNHRQQKGFNAFLFRKLGFLKDVKKDIINYIKEENLKEFIELKGFVADINDIYGRFDVLCFPSHINAVGRPVFEAAFFGKPSIVAFRDRSEDEGIIHQSTGLIIREKDPEDLADAMLYFIRNPHSANKMGIAAKKLAENKFNIEKNAEKLLKIYQQIK